MPQTFIHLHLHTEYSLIDGIVRIEELIALCKEKKFAAVAMTDHCNLFAAVKFYQEATRAGIKPIIGAEVLIANDDETKSPFPIVMLCQNQAGYLNLTKLISKSYVEGQVNDVPIMQKSWLISASEGLIVLSGGIHGDIAQALLSDNLSLAKQNIKFWQENFSNRFYFEITRTGRYLEEEYIHAILPFAQQENIPVVATNDVRFLHEDDYEAHEGRVCIHQGYTLEDNKRPRIYSEQQYFRDSKQMQELFADIPEALMNSVEIAKRCNLKLSLYKTFLPNFPTPNNQTVEKFLIEKSKVGLQERLQAILQDNDPEYLQKKKIYEDRLQLECDVINKMGFAGYFLIVADFIEWANNNGVPVGPGRGSGAGSLVAFALKITGLDPLPYDLLFERFLNPERISMPDFDIDFCMDGRDRVIDYVAQKYGQESVSQIITFGTMAAKAVVRDVGRVLGLPYGYVDKIAKLIPFELGITLEKAIGQEEQLRERYEKEEDVRTLIDLAKKLEGIVRNAGKHAGGVVISPSLITDFTPLYCEPGGGHPVTQFDKDDVEAIGLVKFDFLGLRTLTIIDWALQTINAKRKENNEDAISIEHISLTDEKTFTLLKSCATTGVFQLESRGMKDLIKRLQPDCFEEILALVALFRPGPLQSGMVDDFINRKHGIAKIEFPHEKLEPVLRPTYGVILYQEQVMQIAQVLAGYTLGGADVLRRAMGKKKPEEMAKQREIFVKGAKENGVDGHVASAIFDLMEKFSGYGFNKSHSAAYALVSYQTAWLKAHYPAAFMAAVLSSDMDNTDKVVIFIEECRQMKLKIIPPDINHSYYKFTIADDNTIIYGLGAVKGAGESAIEILIDERNKRGKFRDLFDLCKRVDLRKVNRRVLEALIKSGSLDSFNIDRSMLMVNLDNAIKSAESHTKNLTSGQNDLFASFSNSNENNLSEQYVVANVWSDEERLQGEKETLGLYFSGHPLDQFRHELTEFITAPIQKITLNKNQSFVVAGVIVALRIMFTKRGDRMAFITLDDVTGKIELAIFSDTYAQYHELIAKDNLVVITAEGSMDEYSGNYKINAKQIMTIDEARFYYGKYILLKVANHNLNAEFIDTMRETIKPYTKGKMPVCLRYANDEASGLIELGKDWFVIPNKELLGKLRDLLGNENVKVVY